MKAASERSLFLLILFLKEVRSVFVDFRPFFEDNDFHFVEHLVEYSGFPVSYCLLRCQSLDNCVYVGFLEVTLHCSLHGFNATMAVSGGRTNYALKTKAPEYMFTGNRNINLKNNYVSVWQSSTYTVYGADQAVDGNYNQDFWDGLSCTLTNNHNSFWAIEFDEAYAVTKVDMYLRVGHVIRNTNFIIFVSKTRAELDNDIGIECGRYFGPNYDIAPHVLTINCPYPIYGKALKIKHELNDVMVLCEVDVFAI